MASEVFTVRGSEPLYQQAAHYLRQRIADGTYPPASALPSENELAALLGIGRPTLRHALRLLSEEGLTVSTPGRGHYVTELSGAFARRRTGNIGLIVLDTRDQFMMGIIIGAEQMLRKSGLRPVLCSSRNEIGAEQTEMRDLWEQGKVDGFLIMPADSPHAHQALSEYVASRVPLVLVDRFFDDLEAPFVASDDFGGGSLVTQHLLGLGHRRIGFVTGSDLYVSSVAKRLRGYRQALDMAGVGYDVGLVFQGLLPYLPELHFQEERTGQLAEYERSALRDYLGNSGRPSAVIASNDGHAVRVMEVCRELGLRIPEDLALVGYADEPFAALLTPPLTTVRQQPQKMGGLAAAKLVDLLQGRSVERDTFIPVELVVRHSSGVGIRA